MASILPVLLLLSCTISLSTSYAESSRKELRSKKVSTEALTHLDSSIQASRIKPLQVVQISWQPRVFVYKGFVSDEECNHLISLAQQNTNVNSLGRTKEDPSTRSDLLLAIEDDIVSRVEEKISAWTLLPRENSRPLQVLHYWHEEASQRYDYFGNRSALEAGQPLMATVILCLSNVTQGGDIVFPESKELRDTKLWSKVWSHSTKSGNLLSPIKGNAVLFFHVHPNASPDKSSSHERHPVVEGEMWCATKHFYLGAISVQGVQFDLNNECTDEDESCPRWAALGECQRNPVFMVGSPDYYGTCRKSCNVC